MRQDQSCIGIVGKNNLLNKLLSSFLQDSMKANCLCTGSIEEAAQSARDRTQQLILLDCFIMPADDILSLLQSQSLRKLSESPMALFNLCAETSVELSALRYGIRGFFYCDDPPDSLAKGITALLNNDYWVSRKLLVQFLSTPNQSSNLAIHYPGLTLRESELLSLLAQGLSNQSIADRLFISIPTVKSHLTSIYRKIKVSTRLQAVCWAENNLSNRPHPLV
jgi:LuxR family transcriptional regulator, positive regulator of biofilm formation